MDQNVEMKGIIKDAFSQYAGAVIQSRALTDVRDCIKPSARQIYYSMYTDKFTCDKPFKKTLKAIGSAMRFYIHGDASCEGIIMRSGQPFSMRYPLVEVEGSYGNLMETGNWAAPRYTAARLSKISEYLLKETNTHSIDEWIDNYDDTEQYPRVLSSLGFYNIVNGSMGIAVGLASSIPQFNLKEVNEAMIKLLKNPNCSDDEIICYPDFATGGVLINQEQVKESIKAGKGKGCILQAVIDIDKKSNIIIVRELPYSVYTNTVCSEIEKLVSENPDIGITGLNDLTGEQVCIKIYLNKNANPENVINFLYANTSLQKTYGINMTMLENGRYPKVFGWRKALTAHLNFEREVYTKTFKYEKAMLERRINIIDGILKAIDTIDNTIKIIKESNSTKDAGIKLQKEYDLNEEQSKAILDIKLARLARLESEKLTNERENKLNRVNDISEILNSEEKMTDVIIQRLQEVIESLGDERRTQLINKAQAVNAGKTKTKTEEIPRDVVVTLDNGYIKVIPVAQYRKTKNFLGQEFKCTTKDLFLLFSNKGKSYRVSVKDTGVHSSSDKGKACGAILKMEQDERIIYACSSVVDNKHPYITFVTDNGLIKKTSKDKLIGSTRNLGGVKCMGLDNNYVASIFESNGDVLTIGTKQGYCLSFKLDEVRETNKTSKGIIAIKLSDGDSVNMTALNNMPSGSTIAKRAGKGKKLW